MKKNNNSLLYAILGGVVTCFICVGMVFIYSSKGTKTFQNNYAEGQIQQDEYDEEIELGDECTTNTWYTCASGTLSGAYCYTNGASTTVAICNAEGGYYISGTCYLSRSSATRHSSTTCTSCDPGKYLSGNICASCPANNACAGGTAQPVKCTGYSSPNSNQSACVFSCPVGYGYDSEKNTCRKCASGYVSAGGKNDCTQCTGYSSPNSDQSACVFSCPTGYGYDSEKNTCRKCASGYVSTGGKSDCKQCVGYNVPNADNSACELKCPAGMARDQFGSCSSCAAGYVSPDGATTCTKCENGQIPNSDRTKCVDEGCPAGQGKKSAASNCATCDANYYSGDNDDNCYQCPTGTTSKAGATSKNDCISACETGYYWDTGITGCKPCPDGTISPKGASNVSQCLKECTKITKSGECSARSDCEWNNGACGPKALDIVVNGGGRAYVSPNTCKSFSFTVSYKSGTAMYSASSITWGGAGSSCSGKSCTIKVCGRDCVPDYDVKVTATVAGKTATGVVHVTSYKDWDPSDWNKEPDTKVYIYNTTALNEDVCIAYSDPKTVNGVITYGKKWDRCCRPSGGSSTPQTTPTPTIPYCYVDGDGGYHWTSSPEASWKKVASITKKDNCKKEESPACYMDTKGNYVWGKYASKPGFTLIASITDQDTCKDPSNPDYACYKNAAGDYKWTSSPPSGYTKVEGVTSAADCGPEEQPACYLYNNDFVWGKYARVTGYIYIENITTPEACKKPETDACYKAPSGEYVWGKYGNDSKYELVPGVTSKDQCKSDVPVPKTAANVSKLVYVFMAVLMACGIGFIYYSSVVKKSNK